MNKVLKLQRFGLITPTVVEYEGKILATNQLDVKSTCNLWRCHFGFYPSKNGSCTTGSYGYQNFYNKGIEPHVYCDLRNPDGSINTDTPGLVTKNDLYTHPSMYTKAIQINGWTIPDDYPIRF